MKYFQVLEIVSWVMQTTRLRYQLFICVASHLKAARDSFFSGVRFLKAYVTSVSGKYFRTAHCIVSLYRSVSRKDMIPSGYLEDPMNSMLADMRNSTGSLWKGQEG